MKKRLMRNSVSPNGFPLIFLLALGTWHPLSALAKGRKPELDPAVARVLSSRVGVGVDSLVSEKPGLTVRASGEKANLANRTRIQTTVLSEVFQGKIFKEVGYTIFEGEVIKVSVRSALPDDGGKEVRRRFVESIVKKLGNPTLAWVWQSPLSPSRLALVMSWSRGEEEFRFTAPFYETGDVGSLYSIRFTLEAGGAEVEFPAEEKIAIKELESQGLGEFKFLVSGAKQ